MTLPNATATFRDSGPGWVYWLIDINDPTGKTRSPDQTTPTFTRDVAGNPFDTDTIYLAASSHPVIGDGLVPFRFDEVTGLPVIVDGTVGGSGEVGSGNGNTIGGHPVQITSPTDGQGLSFFTLPNGKKILINTAKPTLDQLAQDTPELQQDTYEADRVSVVVGGKLRAMSWARLTAYVAVLMPDNIVGGFAARIRNFLSLDQLASISVLTYNLIFRGASNILGIRDVGENTPFGMLLNRAGKGFIWGIYFDESGNLIVKVDGSERLLIRADQFAINHDTINLNGTVTVNNLYQKFPAQQKNPGYFWVGDSTNNGVPHQILGVDDVVNLIITHPRFVANYGQPTNPPEISRQILCYKKYDTNSVITVTPGQIGQVLTHGLHLPASQLFGRVSYPDGSDAPGYAIAYPTPDSFRVDYAGASGETSDLIVELKKRTS